MSGNDHFALQFLFKKIYLYINISHVTFVEVCAKHFLTSGRFVVQTAALQCFIYTDNIVRLIIFKLNTSIHEWKTLRNPHAVSEKGIWTDSLGQG